MPTLKKWILSNGFDREAVANLAHQINVPFAIAVLLFNRGVDSFEKAKAFIRAEKAPLNDPFLMKDMDRATERVIKACREKQHILVYGDYDVDGTSSTSMLYLFLDNLNPGRVDYYIPDRHSEGYGLSIKGMDHAFKSDVELLITVDCGITAHEEIGYGAKRDMDIIVCDHHLPQPGDLPPAHSVLNPNRVDCSYPFKHLCGAGVVFKLIHAVCDRLGYSRQTYEQYLDLVALATSADIVQMSGENRTMVKRGLEILNETARPGIRHLIKNARLSGQRLGVSEIVFSLGPRINSVGRLGDAKRAVRLLICEEEGEAKEFGNVLESTNTKRRDINESVFEEALELATVEVETNGRKTVVIFKEDWNYGVVGIVASKIVEMFHRPAIIMTKVNGVAKGSARSILGFDVHKAIESCGDLLTAFGGHKYAAGLTLDPSNIPVFVERINAYAERELDDRLLIPEVLIDSQIRFPEINARFLRLLQLLAPHGPGNLKPVFVTRSVEIARQPVIHHDRHLQLMLRHEGKQIAAIGFNLSHLNDKINASGPKAEFDIVYQIAENFWQGRKSVQLRLIDLDASVKRRLGTQGSISKKGSGALAS